MLHTAGPVLCRVIWPTTCDGLFRISHSQFLTSAMSMLGGSSDTGQAKALELLAPFLTGVLLGPSVPNCDNLGGAATALAAGCHAQLVRLACGSGSLQVRVLCPQAWEGLQ